MRHQVKSKRINRDRSHLDAMLKNLTTSVILHERVKTTQAKAKLVKPVIEKVISIAKKNDTMNAMRKLNAFLPNKSAAEKLVKELVLRYKDRPSGHVRLTKLGFRAGDAAPMVQIDLV